ncbi:MAG: hypothetical protein KatS3mg096_279 [Candidatus Parcubacteria bacterium]|nr:MAG: hypothetical protein KatS3mg096_279 [Candidatus Parcubacteria bacterium]
MKAKELRNKSIEELRKLAEELRKNISQMLLDKSLRKLTKPHLLRMAKKDLARILTIIKEKSKQ